MSAELLAPAAALLAGGAVAGFAAGLFGIGGGTVMVPILAFVFTALGYPDATIMHCAVATSSAVIVLSSVRSVRSHNAHGAVDWDVVWPANALRGAIFKSWGLWIGAGALLASAVLAQYISGRQLSMIFGAVLIVIALQFMFGRPNWKLRDSLPGGAARPVFGGAIGALSALMGIGGGAITVSLMVICGKRIHRAIGTASGIGIFISVPAAIGFIISGQGIAGRPPLSLGYVNVTGFVLLSITALIFVPLGANAAHKIAVRPLKIVFGVFLLCVSVNMIRKAVMG